MLEDTAYSKLRKFNIDEKRKKTSKPGFELLEQWEIVKASGIEFLTDTRKQKIISVIQQTLQEAFSPGSEAQDIMLVEGEKPEIRVKGLWMPLEQCPEWDLEHFNFFLFNQSRLSTPKRNGKFYVGTESTLKNTKSNENEVKIKYSSEPIDLRNPKYADKLPILDNQFYHYLMMEHGNSYDYSLTIRQSILRIHVYSAYGTGVRQDRVAVSIRIVPQEIPKLKTLNLPNKLEDITKYDRGLFLVSGGNGDGKSTTVASIINKFNHDPSKRRVINITEDPIEYIHKPVNAKIVQRRLGDNVPSYARASTDSLRESTDIVVFGELRNKEEIQNALRLAEVGKLVIATIHGNSVADTVDIFVGEFPNEQDKYRSRLLENTLGILHQNLIPFNGEQYPLSSLLMLESEDARKDLRKTNFSRESLSDVINKQNFDWAVSQQDWFNEKMEEALRVKEKQQRSEPIENYERKLLPLLEEKAKKKILSENGINIEADRAAMGNM